MWWVSLLTCSFNTDLLPWVSEALELDLNLTRQEIITFLDQPANLGCYSTQTGNTSPLSFTWTKDNQIITESSRLRAFGEVIVVTPKSDSDFGTYMCNITNGVSSVLCIIELSKGLNESGECSSTGYFLCSNYKYGVRTTWKADKANLKARHQM